MNTQQSTKRSTAPPHDIDYDARPSRTDIAKLELLATEVFELSCRIPERIYNRKCQDIAGKCELSLMQLADDIREQIRRLK